MGIAALSVVITVVVSISAPIGASVAVDVADVNPDHPLYGLERLGERIRMIRTEDLTYERFDEMRSMFEKGKGPEYRLVFEEFVRNWKMIPKIENKLPEDVLLWVEKHRPAITHMRLCLLKDAAEDLKEDIEETPEVEIIENVLKTLENLEPRISPEVLEEIEAHMTLLRQKIENVIERYEEIVRPRIKVNIEIEIEVENEIEISFEKEIFVPKIPPENFENVYESQLDEFENLYAEIQLMLPGAPEHTHGIQAVKRLVERASELKNKAVEAYAEGELMEALGLIHSASMLLRNANMIFEHATEWEIEHQADWKLWKECWENMKKSWEQKEEWEELIEKWEEKLESVREKWRKGLEIARERMRRGLHRR
jgi:tetratricopeptide (TPR) repeat protein